MRYTVHFEGRVQGVGFRYTVASLSRGFEVAGYVRNLDDGRVQLVAEGDAAELKKFVQAIQSEMAGHVRRHTVDAAADTGEFGPPRAGGLTIRH